MIEENEEDTVMRGANENRRENRVYIAANTKGRTAVATDNESPL